MSRVYRVYPNKLGADPAKLVEQAEPKHGYVTGYRYRPPSPEAAKIMEECVYFAEFWLNSFQHAADRKWKREDAVHRHRMNTAHCRKLNAELLREYLPSLRGEDKMRAYRTIAHLKALQG